MLCESKCMEETLPRPFKFEPKHHQISLVMLICKGFLSQALTIGYVDLSCNPHPVDVIGIAFHTYFDSNVISNSVDPGILILQESDGFGLLYNK